MEDEDKYRQYANIPIPSYEEAISRPSSSQNLRGPQEVSDDAERQGLLGQRQPQSTYHPSSTYHPPTVHSERSSVDSDLQLPEAGGGSSDGEPREDAARRHIEELDYLDPLAAPQDSHTNASLYHRARSRSKFAARLSSLGATLSALRLPSFRSFYSPVAAEHDDDDATPAAGEQLPSRETWLIRASQRLPRLPERYRISGPNVARLCGLFTLVLLVYVLLVMDIFPSSKLGGGNLFRQFDPEVVRVFVQEQTDASRIREYLRHISEYDHVAGTQGDFYMAEWMRERWVEEGGFDDTALLSYYVHLNYPTADGRSVSIVRPKGKEWTAQLEEDTIDPQRQQTLAWHGYSKSGEAEGHLVFANGGSTEDFAWLRAQGIELKGSIALVRYYGTQEEPALKVRAAEEAGCVGVLIYSDAGVDGSAKGSVWPDGPWRPEDSVQRDNVGILRWIVGDPLTPGYASNKDSRTISREASPALPKIPSLPLSWRDAKVLLASLQGKGVRVPEEWVGGSPEFPKEWYSGTSPDADSKTPIVHLRNLNDESDKQQIWNIHGLIQGFESPSSKVIVGNHHDAWCFGSVSPGIGSAVMMELVYIFGQLRRHGWSPRRSIEFISWDATEFNLVGSTEYVEDNMDYLRENAIAYLNVDTGVYGPESVFRAAGSPLWQRTLMHALDRVGDPNTNASLLQLWDSRGSGFEGLGTASDYVAFQDMVGASSIDFGFEGAAHAYPRHSCYETFDWMASFGDPEFHYSRALAQIWALLILEMADRPIIPYDVNAYAEKIQGPWLQNLEDFANAQYSKLKKPNDPDALQATGFNLEPLRVVAAELSARAADFHHFEDGWTTSVLASGGFESTQLGVHRLMYNNALTQFDKRLLDLPSDPADKAPKGVPRRPQFKHVIFGPQSGADAPTEYFPFIREALDQGDWKGAQKMVNMTAERLRLATVELKYE